MCFEQWDQCALLDPLIAHPPRSQDVARSLNSLGCLYFSKGDYSECEELQKSALQLLEKEFGAENSRLAKVLNDLATVHYRQVRRIVSIATCVCVCA